MNRLLTGALCAFIISTIHNSQASPVNPQQSLARIGAVESTLRLSATPAAATLAQTITDSKGTPACYAFNLPSGGYIITAADDVAAPILAYSDSGQFDPDNIPPAMQWWLSFYSHEIESAREASSYNVAERPQLATITPLVKTQWDQNSPFNLYTPVINDTQSPSGCVATAMAQLMRYYKYPAKPKGMLSYNMSGTPMALNLDTITFQWDEMPERYGASASSTQKDAVATLMKACGYAVESIYGQYATNASVYLWAPALISYFGYAPSSQPLNRIYFGLYDWEKIIHSSLASGCPVLYSGLGTSGGHAFICDGYSSDGFFHFNWGWAGLSDGYFLLSALNPSALGTGGGDGGFNSGQIAVVNAKPDFQGSAMTPIMGIGQNATIAYSNVSKNLTLSGYIYNYSNTTLEVRPGFEIVAADGTSLYAGESNTAMTLAVSQGVESYARKAATTLADGTYKIYPAFATAEGETLTWHRALVPANMTPYWTLEITSGKGTISSNAPETNLTVTNLKALTKCYFASRCRIGAMLKNNSTREFINDLYVTFYDSTGKLLQASSANPTDIPAGDSIAFEAVVQLSSSVTEGSQLMAISTRNSEGMTASYTDISSRVPVEIVRPSGDLSLQALEFMVENAENVNPEAVNLKITAECTGGYYASPLRVWVRPSDGTSWGPMMLTKYIYLDNGEKESFTFTFPYPDGIPGTKYTIISNYIFGDSQKWFGTTEFVISPNASVAAPEAETALPRYFNLQGTEVKHLIPGEIYIRVAGTHTSRIIAR